MRTFHSFHAFLALPTRNCDQVDAFSPQSLLPLPSTPLLAVFAASVEPFKEAAPGLRRAPADEAAAAAAAADSSLPPLKLAQDIDVASHCFVRIMKFKRKNPIVEAFVPILKCNSSNCSSAPFSPAPLLHLPLAVSLCMQVVLLFSYLPFAI